MQTRLYADKPGIKQTLHYYLFRMLTTYDGMEWNERALACGETVDIARSEIEARIKAGEFIHEDSDEECELMTTPCELTHSEYQVLAKYL